MDIGKIEEFIVYYKERLARKRLFWEQQAFMLGNCYVLLGEFGEAQRFYERSCIANFIPTMFWKISDRPNWLVDIWVLSGRMDLNKDVYRQLEIFHEGLQSPLLAEGFQRDSLEEKYAHGLMELLFPTTANFSNWIQELLEYSRNKVMYAIGQIFQSISDKNQVSFKSALVDLLEAHAEMTEYGRLCITPEKLLCMPAMSLAYAAYKYQLRTEIHHELFSNGYLDFLIQRSL